MGDSFLTSEEIKALVSRLDAGPDEWREPMGQAEEQPLIPPAVSFAPLDGGKVTPAAHGLHNFAAVPFTLQVVLGEAVLTLGDLLRMEEGSVIVLDRLAGENAFLLLNGKPLAEGEVVVINDCFALRVNSLGGDEAKETVEEGDNG